MINSQRYYRKTHNIIKNNKIYVYKFLKSDKFYETVRVLNNGSVNGCVVIINIAFKYSRYSPNRNHIAVSTCKNPLCCNPSQRDGHLIKIRHFTTGQRLSPTQNLTRSKILT